VWRVTRRVVTATAAALLVLSAVYATLAIVLPRIPIHARHVPPPLGVPVYVESNGVHVGFVVPARTSTFDWTRELPPEWFAHVPPSSRYVAIGWGDRRFYLETPTWGDLRLATAVQAAFGLGSAAMQVTYLWSEPIRDERCRRIVLSEEQYRALTRYLLDSFARDEAGRPQRIDHPGYTSKDRFFEAKGRYSLVQTCNEWTGAGLRSIGIRTGIWTPFARDVLRYLEE
jgi:uncharacterized protein (TIGR02117 family)